MFQSHTHRPGTFAFVFVLFSSHPNRIVYLLNYKFYRCDDNDDLNKKNKYEQKKWSNALKRPYKLYLICCFERILSTIDINGS